MEAFDRLAGEIQHLVSEFSSAAVAGDLNAGITQYSFWLLVAAVVFCLIVFSFVKKQSLKPHGVFVNGFEYLVDFVRNDITKGVVGDTWRQHFPFLATVFFFILVNNFIGMIPGMKPGTGAIGSTAALALCSFIYFVAIGMRKHGVLGYIKSLAPAGVMFPINVFVWVIEVFSLLLRPVTLAIRLFCNMFSGHIVMGSFAIMASLFAEPLIQQLNAANAVGALPSVAWLVLLIAIYLLEFVVAFVQAYVFTLLSAVYIQTAEADSH